METLRARFAQLRTHWEDCEGLSAESITQALRLADGVKHTIAQESLFSANELLDDLSTEEIPLLLAPFYQACIYLQLNDQEQRAKNLQFAEGCLEEFLTHLDNYRVLNEPVWNPHSGPSRDQKIAEFKRKKELRGLIEALEAQNAPDELRELYGEQLRLHAYEAADHLRFIQLEAQMLELKREQYSPPPPVRAQPTYLKIDSSNLHTLPTVISGTAGLRTALQGTVFRPGHNLPTMTIEEYGEWELQQLQQQLPVEEELSEDSDHEDACERKRNKDSQWDNWKDEHEKGAGNRNGR